MAMISQVKKNLLVLLAGVLALCVGFCVLTSMPKTVKADGEIISIHNTASVRTDDTRAIRFRTYVNTEYVNTNAENLQVVTIITPSRNITKAEDFTADFTGEHKKIVFSVENNNLVSTSDYTVYTDGNGNNMYNACIYNVQEQNIARDFSARSYLVLNDQVVEGSYTDIVSESIWTAAKRHLEKNPNLETEKPLEYANVSALCASNVATIKGFDNETIEVTVKRGQTVAQALEGVDLAKELNVEGAAYFKGIVEDTSVTLTENATFTAKMNALTIENGVVKGSTITAEDTTAIKIPETYKGEKVVAIGENAFKNNTTITEVEFPEGIEIGRYAFGYCTGITELNFPKLAGIGNCAFEGCTGLTKVVFPKGGENAFDIGEAAFYNCTSLKYVDIRNVGIFGGTDSYGDISYTTGKDIFSGCIGLETFIVGHRFIVNARTFPIGGAQVTNFTPKAILYVDMTTKVSSQNSNVKLNMGEGGTYNVLLSGKMYINGMGKYGGITYVDGETEGTWKMTENGPEGIGHPRIGTETTGSHGGYTFTRYDHTGYWEDTNIEPHNYNENDVCTLCGHNKYGTLTYQYDEGEGGYVLINDDNFTGEVVKIPNTYEGKPVVAIGADAFKNNTTITEVEFPEGIKIGRYAFGYCTGITELNFPKLAGIGNCAFEGCTGLTKVVFPKGGENAFDIGEAAFYNCTSLKYVDIRNVGIFGGTDSYGDISYTTGKDIFSGCIGLETFIVGHRFIVNARTFPIGGAQVTNFTPKAILYVDMTTKVSSQNSNVKLNMGEGGTYNVLLSGKMYINGMGKYGGITYVDGETEGTWKMTENGPEGIGHPRIGTETTGSHGGYTFTRYDHTGYWEDTNIEACNYDENGECTVCKKIKEEQN